MKSTRFLATAAACLTALVAFAAPAAPASAATTTVTFTLAGGTLDVAGDSTFSAAAGSGSAVTLGEVVVRDGRGGTLGWTASAAVTMAAPSGVTPVIGYTSGPITTTGTVTATGQGETMLRAAAEPVAIGTYVMGNNTASWTAHVTLTSPTDAQADAYTGTVTHSVV